MKKINFPNKEYSDLKKRLSENKNIFTLRVSKEQGKYKKDEVLKSSLKELLRVVDVKTIYNIESYKFVNELSLSKISMLRKYKIMDVIELKKATPQSFTYFVGKKRISIDVEVCDTIWKKFSGLMFRKNSPPLLFPFDKNQKLTIHSFFCKPFTAIWLNDRKQITKKMLIKKQGPYFSGYGKYLLEIPFCRR